MFFLLSPASRSPGNASIEYIRQEITQLQAGVTPQGQICYTPSCVLVIALSTPRFPHSSFPVSGGTLGHLWASGCLL